MIRPFYEVRYTIKNVRNSVDLQAIIEHLKTVTEQNSITFIAEFQAKGSYYGYEVSDVIFSFIPADNFNTVYDTPELQLNAMTDELMTQVAELVGIEYIKEIITENGIVEVEDTSKEKSFLQNLASFNLKEAVKQNPVVMAGAGYVAYKGITKYPLVTIGILGFFFLKNKMIGQENGEETA